MMDKLINIIRLIRLRIYNYFLLPFIPFFAVSMSSGEINSCWSFLLVFPLIPAIATGYVYNNICDAKIDDKTKNPVSAGVFNKKELAYITLFLLTTAVISFHLLYSSMLSHIMFILYILIWFLYSGLGIRIKESYLGPVASSILLSVGGPLIFLTELNLFNPVTIHLLLATFFMGLVIEAAHTLHDFDNDLKSNTKTFSVRLGRKRTEIATLIFAFFSYASLLLASSYSKGVILSNTYFLMCFAVSAIILLILNYKNTGEKIPLTSLSQFYIVYAIIFSILHLNLSMPQLILILWIISFIGTRITD